MRVTRNKNILNNIKLVNGDIFQHIGHYIDQSINGTNIIIPHVCNNANAFGAGFAAAVAQHYPIVKENYHLLNGKQFLGYTQFVTAASNKEYGYKIIFANMIAQNGVNYKPNNRLLNYGALVKSMISVSQFISQNFDKNNPVQIHAPKFGCGLAGGDWHFIQELIKDIWTNQIVFVYQK